MTSAEQSVNTKIPTHLSIEGTKNNDHKANILEGWSTDVQTGAGIPERSLYVFYRNIDTGGSGRYWGAFDQITMTRRTSI